MATSQISEVIQHLHRAVLLRDGTGLSDEQLLEAYVSRCEEPALAALVCRHGPMVWGVCQRVLGNYHDAEDAFQATFLVLVRKAASIASPKLLANWLYGVAHQTVLKARATAAKRRAKERQATMMPEPAATEQDLWNDLQPLVDQELSRLPEKYRVAIVLCGLEGKTRKQVARQLGVAEGTLAARLVRGRAMLAKRLARHGLAVSAGSLAAVLAQNAASASAPTSVVVSTIKATSLFVAGQAVATGVISVKVAGLTEGVLKAMTTAKIKVALEVLLGFAVLAGGSALTYRTIAAEQRNASPETATKAEEKPKEDGKKAKTVLLAPRTVVAVDATNRAITVRPTIIQLKKAALDPGDLPDQTFDVAKEVVIEVDDKAAKLADLPVGAPVYVRVSADGKTAHSIRTLAPRMSGQVTDVDAKKGAITIDVGGKGLIETLSVVKGAPVEIDGKPGKLVDLPLAADVILRMSVDERTVRGIRTGRPPEFAMKADVKAVDADKNTLTVTDEGGEQTLTVATDAKIVIGGNAGKLADLKEGVEVDLLLSADDVKVVTGITAGGG
jgi:RNA polymerase sigma factor (sigma-70 family)